MTEAEKAYRYFVIAVPENEEQAKAYFWARKALQSALTQPNEPLTIEQLREMDGQPVWVEEFNFWALVDLMYARGDELLMVLFDDGDIEVRNVELCNLHCYRRPPEGEKET